MTEHLISIAFKIVWGSVVLFWLWSARNVKRLSCLPEAGISG